MTAWTPRRLAAIGDTDELLVSSRRADGNLPPFVPVWVVVVDVAVFVRAVWGPSTGWYRRALANGTGRIHAGTIDVDVQFLRVCPDDDALHDRIDAAYHTKYDRYGTLTVAPAIARTVRDLTIEVVAR